MSQIIMRLYYTLYQAKPKLVGAYELRQRHASWQPSICRPASLLSPDKFLLLNEEGSIAEHGWDGPEHSKLWRYNQHYFDDLNAVGAENRRSWHDGLINDWILNNEPGVGSGWEPYPTSLRIVNWVKASLNGLELSAEAHASLFMQSCWLYRRVEWHLLANHVLVNAKALVFAGCYFQGAEADRILVKGLKILRKELPRQILSDGGHFELSPMYHALALEDVLDLINLMRAYPTCHSKRALSSMEEIVLRMISWLESMSHPDGGIAFFNDAAFGVAPTTEELVNYARELGFSQAEDSSPMIHNAASGYVRLANASAVLIADIAQVGPAYQPGHAHADTLSFELSVFSERLVVNSGTSEYGAGKERIRQRGTKAHSTVSMLDKDSSEVWSGFRVARRARAQLIGKSQSIETLSISASHDGYSRLRKGLLHTRTWSLATSKVIISDEVGIEDGAMAAYHIHPHIEIKQLTPSSGLFVLANGTALEWFSSCEAELVQGTWHPEFNASVPNKCLVLPLLNGQCWLEIRW
ncbi:MULTISPECIES: heparinase II/III family protein [Kordiimonas]|uniref:heparinase II/III family protein n=1 Tax=Kordiimonas TaxID=288021 RepID=UPI00257C0B3B|nr:alginate lyase family protein [Kordiimonas sp. UBA4487]